MIERFELQKVMSVLNEPKKFIQVLVGPRQVGKTNILKLNFIMS
jgi:predicted AAA+ superfamily ATPase